MDECAIGGAGGDVDERVRAVRGIDEVALQHDVGDVAAQSDVVRSERAQDRLEIVDQLGEGRVFQGGAEIGRVEGDFDGGGAVGGEAERAGRRSQGTGISRRRRGGCAERARRTCPSSRRGAARVRRRRRSRIGDLFGDCAGIFKDRNREAAGLRASHSRDDCGAPALRRASCGDRSASVWAEVVLDGRVGGGGGEVLEHGGEFKLGEELAAGGVVDGLGAHLVEGELDRHLSVDGDQFL